MLHDIALYKFNIHIHIHRNVFYAKPEKKIAERMRVIFCQGM